MKKLIYYILFSAVIVIAANAAEQALSSRQDSEALQKGAHAMAAAKHVTASVRPIMITIQGKWISTDTCSICHEDQVSSFKSTTHAHMWKEGQACEQCHGDAGHHLETGGAPGTIQTMKNRSPNEVSATCLNCHEKPGEQSHNKLSQHFRAGVGCTSCHELHPTAEHKAQMTSVGKSAMLKGKQSELCISCHSTVNADFSKPTHHRLKEGILNCTSCHNPHGSEYDHQLRADTKTLCVTCHQDKRGPFVYEHTSLMADGCMACHDSHGSASRHMLKDREPKLLCLSCHSAEMGKGVPHGRGNFSVTTAGDCTRCHSQIHGSNRSEYFIQ